MMTSVTVVAWTVGAVLILSAIVLSLVVNGINSSPEKLAAWTARRPPGAVGNLVCQLCGIKVRKEFYKIGDPHPVHKFLAFVEYNENW
jgi:hypothetical protein